jgi:hypothetical protein
MSRAAFLAMGAASALAMTECGSSAPDPHPTYAQPLYGGVVAPAESDGGRPDGGEMVEPVYGAMVPPPDASTGPPDGGHGDASAGPSDGGPMAQPVYGAMPAPDASFHEDAGGKDAGEKDGGFAVPLYGAVPPPT